MSQLVFNVHDITMLKENPPRFGHWIEKMKSPNTPENKSIHVYTDKWYLGIENTYMGIHSKQPMKKPRGREFTDEERRDYLINSKRVFVEHAIGKIKSYKLLEGMYDKDAKDLNRELQVIGGLVNMRML